LQRFSLDHFERFANHWGAPVPHPSNFLRGGKPALSDGDSDGSFALIPFEQRRVAAVNLAFPGQLECLPHESPAVLVAANFDGPIKDPQVQVGQGGSWHTDIEYEPLPIYVSMFLCHHAPTSRGPKGTWVEMPDLSDPRPCRSMGRRPSLTRPPPSPRYLKRNSPNSPPCSYGAV
jgi:alpha-ketoglutarate-dependent taurine dioxygenase